ncbi:hypothetical protein P691DRAFT_805776 [Macrolepiota fuliginosa MF-IS2]|uniref:Thioesterase domain-containing protein n=1 Tax=Macrolepiota fuliginosa MF-IS2 TaxID=1400762 RepID=A0A9P6C1F7_9AGAR|nr:hypothetical protein P691DRAFT_805776 [Macrolepiota fuliginosa MF-IS2]
MTRTAISDTPSDSNNHGPGRTDISGSRHQIKGNASEKVKDLASTIFSHFIDAKGCSYNSNIGRKLKFSEINVLGSLDLKTVGVGNDLSVETVFEVVVDQDMCNLYGTLHGGCAAYLVDPCSSASLVALGLLLGTDGTGVSQSMNLIWHHPIYKDMKISIKSTSMYITGRVRTARCEIWSGNKLCVSAVHSTINPVAKANKARL